MSKDNVDPYLDPSSGILRNKLGITDQGQLQQAESALTAIRLAELKVSPVAGKYDTEHLKAIHGRVFQDVYDWAGEARTVNIAKGTTVFAPIAFAEQYLQGQLATLQKENLLRGTDDKTFVDKMAHLYTEVNSTHLMREGNGRTQRAFLEQLATESGRTLDFSRVPSELIVSASIASHNRGSDFAKPMIEAALEAGRRFTAETIVDPELRKDALGQAAARAFLVQPRETANIAYPELAAAYGVRDRLGDAASRYTAGDASLKARADDYVARSLARGVAEGTPLLPADRYVSQLEKQIDRYAAEPAAGRGAAVAADAAAGYKPVASREAAASPPSPPAGRSGAAAGEGSPSGYATLSMSDYRTASSPSLSAPSRSGPER